MTTPPIFPSSCQDWGGAGETVILMTEPDLALSALDSVAEALTESFHVMVLDASAPPASVMQHLHDRGVTGCKGVAFGSGAGRVLWLAIEHPDFVDRLVLIDPALTTSAMPIEPWQDESWESFRRRMERLPYFSPWTRYHETLAHAIFDTAATHLVEEPQAPVDYGRVQCPTLILRAMRHRGEGQVSSASDAEIAAMALGILGSRLIELKRHDHWSILLNPTVDVANLIRDFLNF